MFANMAVSILGLCISVFSSCSDSTPHYTHMYYVGEQVAEVLTVDAIGQTSPTNTKISFHNGNGQKLIAVMDGDYMKALPMLHHSFNVQADVTSLDPVVTLDDVVLVAGK